MSQGTLPVLKTQLDFTKCCRQTAGNQYASHVGFGCAAGRQLTLDGLIVTVVHISGARRELPGAAVRDRLVVAPSCDVHCGVLGGLLGSLLAPGSRHNLQCDGTPSAAVSMKCHEKSPKQRCCSQLVAMDTHHHSHHRTAASLLSAFVAFLNAP